MKNFSRNFTKKMLINILFTFVFSIIGIFVSCLTVGKNSINYNANYYETLSKYNDIEYDYVVKNLNNDQIESIRENDAICEVIPYYNAIASILINEQEIDVYIKGLEDDSKIEVTEYSPKRIIEKSEEEIFSIYIGYDFSKTYNIGLNDSIKIMGENFKVTRIYRTEETDVLFVPNLKNIILEKYERYLSIEGVYVTCSDKELFYTTFLKNYKPLALLREEASFNSLAEYQAYLLEFNSKDYSNYVVDKMDGYDEALVIANSYMKSAKKDYVLFGVLSGVFLLTGSLGYLLFNLKKYSVEIVDNGKKELNLRNLIAHASVCVFNILVTLTSYLILVKTSKSFIHYINVLKDGIIGLLLPVLFVLIAFLINYLVINKKRVK